MDSNKETLIVVHYRALVLAGLAVVDYVTLSSFKITPPL